jgi:2-oxoglutarate ferredoxin oxidoreductase subunit gamma
MSSSYGAEARGTASRSEVIISDSWIAYPKIEVADVLVAMSQDGYDKYAHLAKEVLFDSSLIKLTQKQKQKQRHLPIPATLMAEEKLQNPLPANIIMLGALVSLKGIVPPESIIKAIKARVPKQFLEINLKALEMGFNI